MWSVPQEGYMMDVSENSGFSPVPLFSETPIYFGKALLGFFLYCSITLFRLHPRKRTWIPKVAMFERRYMFQGPSFFGIYVRFLEGSVLKLYSLSQCFSEKEGEGRYQVIFNDYIDSLYFHMLGLCPFLITLRCTFSLRFRMVESCRFEA